MHQKGYLALAAGVTLSMGVSATAIADHGERDYNSKYISVMGSYVFTDDDRNVDNAWGGDLRLGKELSEFWNVELSGAVYDEMTAVNAGQFNESQHEQWSLGLNALYFFLRGDHWQPYVAGAVGWSRARVDDLGDERRDFPYAGLALGSIMPFHDSGAGVRFDVQWRYDFVDAASGSDTDNFADWYVNLGLVIPMPHYQRCCNAPAAAPAPAVVIDPGTPNLPTFTIKDVHFAHDSSELRPSAQVILDEVSDVLVANQGVNASVEGHASAPGSEAYNLSLSQRRADIVRDYLVNKGVDGGRLTTEAFGESRPIASNDTEEGQAENRRTEIRVKQ